MPKPMRAKRLFAKSYHEAGDAEDAIVIRRGSVGTVCYSTITDQYQIARLLAEVVEALAEASKGKHDA